MDRLGIMTGILIACIGIGLSITPCLAGERYISGGPDLFVSLGSTSELIPGSDCRAPGDHWEQGHHDDGDLQLPLDAAHVPPHHRKVHHHRAPPRRCPGAGAIQLSDHRGRSSRTGRPCNLHCRRTAGRPAGNYTMLARINYSYVPRIEQEGSADMSYYFREKETVLPLPIKIRRMVILAVEKVESNDLSAGKEGVIDFTIRNTGQDTGIGTSLFLVPEGSSPIVPYSNSVYIGEFPPGASSNRVSRSRFRARRPRGFHIPCPSMRHTRTSRALLRPPPRSLLGYRSRTRFRSNV